MEDSVFFSKRMCQSDDESLEGTVCLSLTSRNLQFVGPDKVVYVPDGEEEVCSPTSPLAVSRKVPRKSAPPFLNCSSPTPEREAPPSKAPPTKAPPTNQIKPSKKKLELTKSQELYPKVVFEVKPGRKRTASSSATLGNELSSDHEGTETYICITSKYISDDQGCVHGVLTVSTTSLMFKPNQSDPLVQEHGVEQYELLIPLDDITHASITRDVAPPMRQPFLSPRRQSSVRTQKLNNTVVMEPLQQATPPENQQDEKVGKTDGETDGGAEDRKTAESGERGVASDGMERSPAPTMSDTDAESERDSGTIAASISLSDVSGPPEVKERMETEGAGKTEGGEGEGEGEREGEREGEGEGEGEGGKEEVDRQTSTDSQPQSLSRQDDDLTASNNLSNEVGGEQMTSSTDDLMAIISGEPPFKPRPHAVSQCSVMSLDALLGDTAYFLHFRVVSNSGQRYTYTPVNSLKGIDIPGEGGGKKAPSQQCVKSLFCFVVPERNLEKVVSFLSLHHPQGSARLGSPSDKQRWTDGHFDVIHGPRSEGEHQELSFCDNHFKNPDSWEVYSLSDIHKYRHVISMMEVEDNLPLPRMSEESVLLTSIMLRKLIIHLPTQAIGHDMQLVYSTFSHGISLRTMYRNMLAFGDTPVLLVARDDCDKVFGAMASSYLRLSAQFYGTGESCLFSFEQQKLEVFPWTGLNSYFIKGNTDSIVIGSGDGHFGLWLDEDFLHGSSYNCETYGNRPLATTEDFLCTGVEAWGFGADNS